MSIPVSALGMMDRLIWKHTPNGQYSVKSGYKVVKEGEQKTKGEAGSSTKADNDKNYGGRFGGWISIEKSSTSYGGLAQLYSCRG